MDPIRNSEAYHSARLGGVRLPGKVIVQGLTSPRNWDSQQGQGTSGATTKYTGPGLAEGTIQVQMWEPAHFDAFERDVRPLLREPLPNVRPSALDLEHPDAQKLGIKRVVVTNVSQLETHDEAGLLGYTISIKQFRPPKLQPRDTISLSDIRRAVPLRGPVSAISIDDPRDAATSTGA